MFTVVRTRAKHAVFAVVAVAIWLGAILPSGFSAVQIAVFAGPGIVLAVTMSWASFAALPHVWNWTHGFRAAIAGATIFPPFVALLFAWGGTWEPGILVEVLVASAWLAIVLGLVGAAARGLTAPRAAPPAGVSHFPTHERQLLRRWQRRRARKLGRTSPQHVLQEGAPHAVTRPLTTRGPGL